MSYRLLNPTKLEVEYVIKRNRRWLNRRLHHPYLHMLQLCSQDLLRSGVVCRIEVVFQTGRSRSQEQYCGLYQHDPTILRFDRIWIYTYKRPVEEVLITLAHEFGHCAHYRTIPASINWSDNLMEQYANLWAKAMVSSFHGNKPQAVYSDHDLAEFRRYMNEHTAH